MAIETSARIAFLKKIHLFHGLDDAEFVMLAEELHERTFAKGDVVFTQDGKADGFYLIYGGSVRIIRKQDKKETQLALLVKNDYFGEMALVANRKRSATVTALTDTTLLELSRADFDNLYKIAPHIKNNLSIAVQSRVLSRKLKFKWIRPDEVIYFLARKHPIVLWEKLILPILALLVPLGLFYAYFTIINFLIVLLAGIFSLLAIIGIMFWLWVDWGNDYYIVTNQRVVWLEKVVGIYDSRQESPLGTILSVGIEVNQLGKILDYGNVIVRTFVGKVPFNHVHHPNHAAKMIEEYWNRTKEHAAGLEKDAMKNAIRKRLGLPQPKSAQGFGEPAPLPKSDVKPPKPSAGMAAILKFLGAETIKLRYETGASVIYRKHWIVLVLQAWVSVAGVVGSLLLFIGRLIQLAFLPDAAFISLQGGGFSIDAWTLAFLIAFVPFAIWFGYELLDWSNDKFEVTSDQIIDIDRKPFGTESRNAAPLEGIMSTVYERKGLLGNIFNYGTVYITVGGSKLAFEDVMDPATVQSDIDRRRMERTAKKNEGAVAAERERMAEWLATYHIAAKDFRDEENKNKK
ncbi:MAG: cyclic nucleotide-binding domain-containing protein [Chloroflexota bacterium]